MKRQTPIEETGKLARHVDFSNSIVAQTQQEVRRERLSPDLIQTQKIPAIPMAQEVYGTISPEE